MLLNSLNNNIEEPKNLRRSSRIASVPRDVAPAQPRGQPKILSAIPIVYPAIDINL